MQNIKHGLYAFSGDCSKGAMGDTSDFIVFKKKHFGIIKQYLRNQLEMHLHSAYKHYTEEPFTELVQKHNDLGNLLIDEGVFQHKWHKRTEWVLIECDDDLKPLGIREDVEIIKQLEGV
jgi:hypothetical protein|tara:strand:- start:433 stop:789 length:357 start_codon:yes stop_codon:yes gene_type:complete